MMRWKVLFALTVVCIAYICIGGAVFQALEQQNEDETITSQGVAYEYFLRNYSCVSKDELRSFIKSVIHAYDQGVLEIDSASSGTNWNYVSSTFFSVTVVTTIGYGHISPSTFGGKMFFIIYALVGIPLTGIVLAGLGEKISNVMKKIKSRTFMPRWPKLENVLKSVVLFVLCLLLLVLIPSVIFESVEGWTFADSVYYCIVTMTTVGFGDFVPGGTDPEYRTLYRIFIATWIIFGLAWLAMVINTIATFYNKRISETHVHISSKKKSKDNDNNLTDIIDSKADKQTKTDKQANTEMDSSTDL